MIRWGWGGSQLKKNNKIMSRFETVFPCVTETLTDIFISNISIPTRDK